MTFAQSPAPAPVLSILDAIGATPCLQLSRSVGAEMASVFLKLELLNPAGSIKERICHAMIERAEDAGLLSPGGTVIEPTSGNTGIGLALVCAVKGYKLILTMPESMSLERRALLQAYGARIELTPAHLNMEGAIARARELVIETPGAFMPGQFDNFANREVHAATTARELLETIAADGGRIDAFVAGVGTGGTVSGVGRELKRVHPKVQIVAVEPQTSAVLSGEPPGPHRIQGIGAGFVPPVLDREVVDRIVAVSDAEAWAARERLGREEGLLVGISTGANVTAALQIAREIGPGGRVYTVACDTGERYFSLAEHFTAAPARSSR